MSHISNCSNSSDGVFTVKKRRITPDIVDFQTLVSSVQASSWSSQGDDHDMLMTTVHDCPWLSMSPFLPISAAMCSISHSAMASLMALLWISLVIGYQMVSLYIIFAHIIDGNIGYHWHIMISLDTVGPRIDLVIRHQHEFAAHSAVVLVWSNPASWKKIRRSRGTPSVIVYHSTHPHRLCLHMHIYLYL